MLLNRRSEKGSWKRSAQLEGRDRKKERPASLTDFLTAMSRVSDTVVVDLKLSSDTLSVESRLDHDGFEDRRSLVCASRREDVSFAFLHRGPALRDAKEV